MVDGDGWTSSPDHPSVRDGDNTNNLLEVCNGTGWVGLGFNWVGLRLVGGVGGCIEQHGWQHGQRDKGGGQQRQLASSCCW